MTLRILPLFNRLVAIFKRLMDVTGISKGVCFDASGLQRIMIHKLIFLQSCRYHFQDSEEINGIFRECIFMII